jgi:hypothetical protein
MKALRTPALPARLRSALVAMVLAQAAACADDAAVAGADGDADGDGDVDVSDLALSQCPEETRFGGFEVELADGFTGVQGRVFDGVTPSAGLETLANEGACRHLRTPRPFCDPSCAPGDACTAEGCLPSPESRAVGTVTVRGLAAAVEMAPVPPGFFYTNPDPLPHPGFAAGDAIELTAEGFTLRGLGTPAIAGTANTLTVEPGADLVVVWEASELGDAIGVTVTLNVNQHGVTGSRIACEVDDSGDLTIPAALVTALVDDGLSGFPSLVLRRRSADSTLLDGGCVDLQVLAQKTIDVEIEGLTSCNEDGDCPDGETCRGDLTCGPPD